jgi:hypothetical protein
MDRLVLWSGENTFSKLIAVPYGDIIEVEIANGEPQAAIYRVDENDAQTLYNYLGEWLAARQNGDSHEII